MTDNEQRVLRAQAAITIGVLDHEDTGDELIDLLTNLRHYAEAEKLDYARCARMADLSWQSERSSPNGRGDGQAS